MKFLIFSLLAISPVLGSKGLESCICIQTYDPVCALDGTTLTTYANMCEFNCAQATNPGLTIFSQGACASSIDAEENEILSDSRIKNEDNEIAPCFCAMDYKPVCGTDGRTYGNICYLNCARRENPVLGVASQGQCANEGVALANKDIPLQHLRPIPYAAKQKKQGNDEYCLCTREYRPVCANNGVTYPNSCELKCAAKSIKGLMFVYFGSCEE